MKATKLDFYQKNLPILLTVMILLFALLVPGGPVENRDFSHMISSDPLNLFNLFNAFLIIILMMIITMIFYTQTRARWTYYVSIFLGISFVFIAFIVVDSWVAILVAWFAYKSLKLKN
jgi:uncharacterized BrkB/YihY/UPF0761 family membrane protein